MGRASRVRLGEDRLRSFGRFQRPQDDKRYFSVRYLLRRMICYGALFAVARGEAVKLSGVWGAAVLRPYMIAIRLRV